MSSVNTHVDNNIHDKIMLLFAGDGFTKSMLQLSKDFEAIAKEFNLDKNTHEWHKYRNLFICELTYMMNSCLTA
jgi:hypothetical protein